jgi:hypothetical protein
MTALRMPSTRPWRRLRAAVVIRPMGLSWDAVLVGDEPPNVECKARLAEINRRLREEFELAE